VHAFTAGWLTAENLETDLAPVQRRWAALVERRPLPWYAAEQARRGAFAALVGLTLGDDGSWSALAVGDCCLFHLRRQSLLAAFPVSDADAFDNRPLLIGSRAWANQHLRACDAIATTRGTWQPGDAFVLMSDALAAAFLRLARSTPLLEFIPGRAGFRDWITALRAERVLRNDDVTLLWVDATA
jgi:hypothetical protein